MNVSKREVQWPTHILVDSHFSDYLNVLAEQLLAKKIKHSEFDRAMFAYKNLMEGEECIAVFVIKKDKEKGLFLCEFRHGKKVDDTHQFYVPADCLVELGPVHKALLTPRRSYKNIPRVSLCEGWGLVEGDMSC